MTEREKQRALERAEREVLRNKILLVRNAQAEINRLMRNAMARIQAILADQPSDYERWHLPQVEREIARALEVFRAQGGAAATRDQDRAWSLGSDLVDKPLEAAGIRIAGITPLLTQTQLQALKSFLTDRIRDVTAEAINRINSQLGLVVIGAQTPFQAVKAVAAVLEDQTLVRASRIVRTEVGRAFSVAGQERMNQAAKVVDLDKVWRRSGKPHQRVGHALADGQRVPHNEPFEVISKQGEVIRLMFPRDPKAPAGEVINCGCVSVPRVKGWASTRPDRVPFTERELDKNPELKKLVIAKRLKK
jgi:hypothetical protein